MSKIICIIVLFFSLTSFATECETKLEQLTKVNENKTKQIENLNEVVRLKDLIITKQDERIDLWRQKSLELDKEINSLENWKDVNKTVYFFLGVGFMTLSVWAAGQIN